MKKCYSRFFLWIFVMLFISVFIDVLIVIDSDGRISFLLGFIYSFISSCSIYFFVLLLKLAKNVFISEEITLGSWVEISDFSLIVDPDLRDMAPVLLVKQILPTKVAKLYDIGSNKIVFIKLFRLKRIPDLREGRWVFCVITGKYGKIKKIISGEFSSQITIVAKGLNEMYEESSYYDEQTNFLRPVSNSEIFNNDLT